MKLQSPKGTRDFFPEQMAWRNFLVDAWRRVSIRNGFEQVDGPIFETLDLYKVKSGESIVSEVFHVTRQGSEREYALRPEFTPTLARMVASQGGRIAKPIKWFCTPNCCRGERPQKGRLREFLQWNVDVLGSDAALADAECIFTAVDLLAELGLGPEHIRVKISHRRTVRHILGKLGVADDKMLSAFELLDRRDKMEPAQFLAGAAGLGLNEHSVERFDQICRMKYRAGDFEPMREQIGVEKELDDLLALDEQIAAFGIADWCEYDLGIVRGLAYYTGTVFEINEISGMERAIAGGGRYDNLIELFGGQPTPAVGFGMGDVVLTNVLTDKGLLPEQFAPRPWVYIIAVTDTGAAHQSSLTAALRRNRIHARLSYKTGRNVGKRLKEAADAKVRYTVILDDSAAEGLTSLKDMDSGEQIEIAIADIVKQVGGA